MTPGHGQKFNRRKDAAIAALLATPTIAAAAAKAGISETTLDRWLRMPSFQRQYRQARWRVLEGAVATLQSATVQAVETLKKNLTCGAAGDENRAALGILSMALRSAEMIDLESRIAHLETQNGQPDAPMGKVG